MRAEGKTSSMSCEDILLRFALSPPRPSSWLTLTLASPGSEHKPAVLARQRGWMLCSVSLDRIDSLRSDPVCHPTTLTGRGLPAKVVVPTRARLVNYEFV